MTSSVQVLSLSCRSATIDYLKLKADTKVIFFYCKRDEEIRRDRSKILLSLAKQLACPYTESNSICVHALDAYKQEQKDPSSRKQLSVQATINLLIRLLSCYQYPVIMLDALDECSKDTRHRILEDFRLILEKSSSTIKILVSSRYTLDIEDSLRNAPHVNIEAKDNAEDIERYVEMELNNIIMSRRLLRGKVTSDLKELIKQVLLRDARGM